MDTPLHIATQFDADIQVISSNIIRMAGLAEDQLGSALRAFAECDVANVDALIARDRDIDQLELIIDHQCANFIARRQPVAIDLRMVVVIGKMVTDLERIGDESKKIARSINRDGDWEMRHSLAREVGIPQMGQLAADQVRKAVDAYVRLDDVLAENVRRSDKGINAVYRSACQQLIDRMMAEPQTVPTAMELFSIAKSLERIGDHAKKIARNVIFIVSGRDIRHPSIVDHARTDLPEPRT